MPKCPNSFPLAIDITSDAHAFELLRDLLDQFRDEGVQSYCTRSTLRDGSEDDKLREWWGGEDGVSATNYMNAKAALQLLEQRSPAATDVLDERRRQQEVEGWTPEHDDRYEGGELSLAGADYALNSGITLRHGLKLPGDTPTTPYTVSKIVPPHWPFADSWWKPKSVRRDLVRAGALIIAEIERLDRLDQPAKSKPPEGDKDVARLPAEELQTMAADENNGPPCSQCGSTNGEHWDTGCDPSSDEVDPLEL